MSKKERFEARMRKADRMRRSIGQDQDYWTGYIRGLRRAYHGDSFGTEQEHELWLALSDRHDHTSRQRGSGYIDGLAALDTDDRPALPSPEAVQAVLKRNCITGRQAARMMYLSDARQVRKYTGGAHPRQMDGARWFALHAHILLPPEQIELIEAAMEESLVPPGET